LPLRGSAVGGADGRVAVFFADLAHGVLDRPESRHSPDVTCFPFSGYGNDYAASFNVVLCQCSRLHQDLNAKANGIRFASFPRPVRATAKYRERAH
jgi:hypothetical protein